MTAGIDLLLKIISVVLTTAIGYVVKKSLEGKPKLITYLVHASAIPIHPQPPSTEPPSQVNIHTYVIRNAGRVSAKNVRVGHNYLPNSFQIYPPVSYQIIGATGGTAEILIPALVPGEELAISYLYFPPVLYTGIHSYTKSDEGFAKVVNAIPTPQPTKLAKVIVLGLMFIGACSIVYWISSYFLTPYLSTLSVGS
jgi:hypothetical protein